jgi:phosphate transport system protein
MPEESTTMSQVLLHPHNPLLDQRFFQLRSSLMLMGDLVDQGISQSLLGLRDRDIDLCGTVIAQDSRINGLQREIRELCFVVTLTQTPVACDLREITSIMHMASELERMGDHAVSIARIARRLASLPDLGRRADLTRLGVLCREQLCDILAAVIARDAERGRQVAARDDRVDRVYHRLCDDLLEHMAQDRDNVYAGAQLLFVAHNLERIADRVTNIAEDLVFLETGALADLG